MPLWSSPSRQVISQFNLKIVSNCAASIVTHGDFSNIIYYVGPNAQALTFSPAFTGANNAVCPQTVSLSLKLDGSGTNWYDWSGGTFTQGGTNYNFITSLVTTGAITDLGRFVINYTTQATFRPSQKFNARITLTNSANGLKDLLYFDIIMMDVCEVVELTSTAVTSNIVHTILPASTSTSALNVYWTALA